MRGQEAVLGNVKHMVYGCLYKKDTDIQRMGPGWVGTKAFNFHLLFNKNFSW